MSKADDIKLGYVHIPIFYNAKLKSENETNTIQETNIIQETREFNKEEDIFGYIGLGMLLICCILILHILQEKDWF